MIFYSPEYLHVVIVVSVSYPSGRESLSQLSSHGGYGGR